MEIDAVQKLNETQEAIALLKKMGVEVPEEAYELEALASLAAKAQKAGELRRDDDGHWYAVPDVELEAFDELSEKIEGVEYMADPDNFDEFNSRYGVYRIDGYADLKVFLP